MKKFLFIILNLNLIYNISLNEIKKENQNLRAQFSDKPKLIESSEIKSSVLDNGVIDLDSDYIITRISWVKRESYKYNYLLGIFEGANDPSFKDVIPLGMIKDDESLELINYININTPFSYKYIRYIPPNKNNSDITPIKIYGYKKSEFPENLKEKKNFQATNLPLISIYTENLEEITEKRIKLNCKILIVNKGIIEINETAKINVRDETKAYLSPKFPYSIEFSSRQKVLGLEGKYKKWELISNYFDRSLLRNSLALKLSELMKFEYTVRCIPVDVILNGNFKGNYYICDNIGVGKNRINIKNNNLNENYTNDNDGGYLLEIDAEYYNGKKHFKTDKGIFGKILYPKEEKITPEQENYIINKLNTLEKEVYNGKFKNIDLETYSKQFLLEEFCGDLLHIYSSFYLYKKIGNDKFYFGPVWDFDTAFDNDKRLIPTNEKPKFCFNYYSASGSMKNFTNELIRNKYSFEYIKNMWENLCNAVLNERILIDFLEEQKIYLEESAKLNFWKYDNFVEEYDPYGFNWGMRDFLFGRKGENFELSVEVLKDYILKRFDSLSKLLHNPNI